MQYIHSYNIKKKIKKKLKKYYIICGNETILLQEALKKILKKAKLLSFHEKLQIEINNKTKWRDIFIFCQNKNIFSQKKILVLYLFQKKIKKKIIQNIIILISLIKKDIILIIQINQKIIEIQKNINLFLNIRKKFTFIKCYFENTKQLKKWIVQYSKSKNILLKKSSIKFLQKLCIKNLNSLTQFIIQISLIYPKQNINIKKIKKIIYNTSNFTNFQFINILLTKNSKKSLYILQKLQKENIKPLILLKNIQKIINLLILSKKNKNQKIINIIFQKSDVFYTTKNLIKKNINLFKLNYLKKSINILSKIEYQIKTHQNYNPWIDFITLSLIICEKKIPNVFIKKI